MRRFPSGTSHIHIFGLSALLIFFSSHLVLGQQVSSPGNSSAPGVTSSDKTVPPSGISNSGGKGADSTGVPGLPSGINARVLKQGEKVPQRRNEFYEDWTRPELPPRMQSDVIPLEKAERAGFTREIIHAQWRDYDPIDLYVIRPAGVKNPPVILYLYSYPTSNDRYKSDRFCRALVRQGFAAVGFVPALTEQRFHDRPTQEWFVGELQEALSTTTHDVQMILNYLSTRGDFDMKNVGIWGDGSGAAVAIMAAAVDSRIKAVDLLDPWGDWADWLAKTSLLSEKERSGYRNPEFLARVKYLDPIDYLPRLKTRTVRMQWIDEGISVTPESVREKMEGAVPSNAKIVHYENEKLFVEQVAVTGKSFDWLKGQLGMANLERSSNSTTVPLSPAGGASER